MRQGTLSLQAFRCLIILRSTHQLPLDGREKHGVAIEKGLGRMPRRLLSARRGAQTNGLTPGGLDPKFKKYCSNISLSYYYAAAHFFIVRQGSHLGTTANGHVLLYRAQGAPFGKILCIVQL